VFRTTTLFNRATIQIIKKLNKIMKGIDVSHWQGAISWKNVKTDFAVIKCSEGINYVDPMFSQNKAGARRVGIPCGFYHFATGGNIIDEAKHFVKSVGDIQKGEFIVLDAETGESPQWCRKFLDEVYRLAGFRPIIYCPAGNGWDWSPVVQGNYGLWIARYGLNLGFMMASFPPKIGQWKFYVIWQYTSKGRAAGINGNVDLNYTKCNIETLKKYGKQ
jgi:lysozyme